VKGCNKKVVIRILCCGGASSARCLGSEPEFAPMRGHGDPSRLPPRHESGPFLSGPADVARFDPYRR